MSSRAENLTQVSQHAVYCGFLSNLFGVSNDATPSQIGYSLEALDPTKFDGLAGIWKDEAIQKSLLKKNRKDIAQSNEPDQTT